MWSPRVTGHVGLRSETAAFEPTSLKWDQTQQQILPHSSNSPIYPITYKSFHCWKNAKEADETIKKALLFILMNQNWEKIDTSECKCIGTVKLCIVYFQVTKKVKQNSLIWSWTQTSVRWHVILHCESNTFHYFQINGKYENNKGIF